jgi:hypothetical protein
VTLRDKGSKIKVSRGQVHISVSQIPLVDTNQNLRDVWDLAL